MDRLRLSVHQARWLLATYSSELGLPRLTAHGLRHTSATLMLVGGIPPKVAAERLGHSDPTLFTNLHSHVTPTMQHEAAEKIGALLSVMSESGVVQAVCSSGKGGTEYRTHVNALRQSIPFAE